MLRKRLVTVLTFNDGVLFRTKQFTPDYRYTLNFVDSVSVDEIVVLDITRPGQIDRANFDRVVRRFALGCFVPIAAGGGVRTLDDVRRLLALGADKIVVNTGAFERPELVEEIASRYGSQCVVLSIDANASEDNEYEVFTEFGQRATGRKVEDWAQQGQTLGAGEILVNSIDRDGSLMGYDLKLCRRVSDAVDIPVLICGGAGSWDHFVEGFEVGNASAVCTANIYHFTEAALLSAKRHLASAGIDVRL